MFFLVSFFFFKKKTQTKKWNKLLIHVNVDRIEINWKYNNYCRKIKYSGVSNEKQSKISNKKTPTNF